MTLLLCFMTSLFLFLSFPKLDYFILGWLALIPFFIVVIKSKSLKDVIKKSLFTGILTNVFFLYWLIPMFRTANVNWIFSIIGCLGISFYLGLYFVIFALIIYKYREHYTKLSFLFFAAFLWCVLEYGRTYFLTGFPWNLLGYSQWKNLYFIQISDITGIYGVSFIITLFNFYLASLLISFGRKKIELKNHLTVFAILLICFSYGYARIKWLDLKSDKRINFKILQGNIDQYKKFDAKYKDFIRQRYFDLAKDSGTFASDIFVYPETAFPDLYPDNIKTWFSNLEREYKVIIGAFHKKGKDYYNSAIFMNSNAEELNIYKKRHLVPFGEIFPYKDFFQKFIPAVKYVGGVSAGDDYKIFNFENIGLGVNICFETLFPNEVRLAVREGAQVLINISNDAWYLDTSAPYQHFSFNIFRAIENRRYLVRAANTGISAFVDPFGRVINSLDIYKRGSLSHKTPVLTYDTFYSKYGNIFIYLAIFYCGFYFLLQKKRSKYKKSRN
ncbi:apolipoprotein N-acyltransferase [bacterium]